MVVKSTALGYLERCMGSSTQVYIVATLACSPMAISTELEKGEDLELEFGRAGS